jgi:hypothetical protein
MTSRVLIFCLIPRFGLSSVVKARQVAGLDW